MTERTSSGAVSSPGGPPAAVASADPARLWAALAADTAARVVLVGPDGRVVYANEQAHDRFGTAGGSLVGASVGDLQPGAVGTEWAAWVTRVQETGHPLVATGAVGGLRYRMVIRPLNGRTDPSGRPAVLVVSRDATDSLEDALHPAPPGADTVRSRHDDYGLLSSLTDREIQVLQLIGEGMSTAEIAEHMDRSVKTVEWHRASLGQKLGVTNRIELARLAIRSGLVSLGRGSLRPRRDNPMVDARR